MSRIRLSVRTSLTVCAVVLGTLGMALTSSAASAPAAPSTLTAGFGSGGVVLTWADNSGDETGFSIERCLGSGCTAFGQIATVAAGVTSYTDRFAASGVDRYRVRAFNGAGASGYSNTAETMLVSTGEVRSSVSATPTTGPAPLAVTFDGSLSSSLNGPITSYSWSFGDDQTAQGAVVTHTYAAPGVYAASLRVTGGSFGSADSTAVIITVSAPPLVAPSDLTAASPARARVVLTWTNPASSATSLVVERCKGSGCTAFARIASVPRTATTYTDTTVKGGTTYTYRLAASDGAATVYSNSVVITARR